MCLGRIITNPLFGENKNMSKIKEMEKEGYEDEYNLPEVVVRADDMVEIIIRNACISVDLLHEMSFCSKCHGKQV